MLSEKTRQLLADHGWAVGSILIGREKSKGWWSESIIMVSYISEQTLLCVTLARRSKKSPAWRADGTEGSWGLDGRPWRAATADDLRDAGLAKLVTTLADTSPVLSHLAGMQVARVERGEAADVDELRSLRFELEMTDVYIEHLWEVVFGPDKPMPTVAESFYVGPRRTALKRVRGMCSFVTWPHLLEQKRKRPAPKDLPLGVELEDIDG